MQNYFLSYFNTALQLVAGYDGTQPLNNYLKKYFSLHKKYGSKDRKQISHLCYCYYRLGFALHELPANERLLIAAFLCNDKRDIWLSVYDENWQIAYDENIDKRIAFIQSLYTFSVNNIFFHNDWISNDIDTASFNKSHVIQPDLFLRIRPNKKNIVIDKLTKNNISFEERNDSCLALNNATKVDDILALNKEVVIQDYSSQQMASFFAVINLPKPISVWDCCAASGGKSILAYDYFINIKLTVSDIRSSIIHNLKERFQQAGIHQYNSFVADVSAPNFISKEKYDFVICDAPCSGSGTWSRTPEQLFFFTENKLLHYMKLQKKITANAVKAVKSGGYFLYITCSVFKQENEDMVDYIKQVSKFTLIRAEAIKGYDIKADTMYAALFIN